MTAVQDGQKSIHPAAISCFAAAESNLTAESHAKAESLLRPQMSYEGHTCVVDGAPCLAEAATKHYAGVAIARCRRHFREALIKTAEGRRDLAIFDKIAVVPRTRLAVAEALYNSLPNDSPLHDIPKAHICDAYLPDGVHNHGVRTNNPAEVWNWMSMCARSETTMFRALLAVEKLLATRQEALYGDVKREKMKNAPAGTTESQLRDLAWNESASIPKLVDLNEQLRTRSQELPEAKRIRSRGGGQGADADADDDAAEELCWNVSAGHEQDASYTVNLNAIAQGKYDQACTCGQASSAWVRPLTHVDPCWQSHCHIF